MSRCARAVAAALLVGAAGCGDNRGGPLWLDAEPGVVAVGDFTVELTGGGDEDAALVIRHASRAEPVLETRPGQPFVWAADGREKVSDLAGAFTIEDQILRACDGQIIARFGSAGEGAAVLAGTLRGPDCAAGYELTLRAGDGGELELALALDGADPELDRVALSVRAGEDERFLGFGVQYSVLEMSGRAVPIWVREQGIGRGQEPVTSLVDAFYRGSGGDWHTSYAPLPFTLTSAGRALSLDGSRYAVFDFTGEGAARIEQWSSALDARLWVADRPLELIEGFTGRTGRMAPLPAWTGQGAVVRMSGGSDAVRARVAALQDAGVPLAAVWLEDWVGERETPLGSRLWWNWEVDRARYPDWEDLVAELLAGGIRTLIYFNPYLADPADKPDLERNLYAEAEAAGHLVRAAGGAVHILDQAGFEAAMIDLSSPAARDFLREVIEAQLAIGVAGFMADFGEALPFDAELASGEDAAAFHNRYPVEWARLTREAIAGAGATGEAIAFHRSGFLGSAAEATMFWLGDQLVTWDAYDGMATVVHGLLSGGLSGIALNHSDIGGYTSVVFGELEVVRSRELLWRWIELAAFTPVFRTHETLRREENVQIDSDVETLAHFARFARVFAALADYRAGLMEEAAATGAPLVRHLLLHAPDDPDAWEVSDQFLLGPEVLVAPVLEEGATEREVYLPAGRWVYAWSGEELGDPDAGVRVTAAAPLGQPPVYVRAGSPLAAVLEGAAAPAARPASSGTR